MKKRTFVLILAFCIGVFAIQAVADEGFVKPEAEWEWEMVDNPNLIWDIPLGIPLAEASDRFEKFTGVDPEGETPIRIQGLDFDVRLLSSSIFATEPGIFKRLQMLNTLSAYNATEEEKAEIVSKHAESVNRIINMLREAFGQEDYSYICNIRGDCFSDGRVDGNFEVPYDNGMIDYKRILDSDADSVSIRFVWNNVSMSILISVDGSSASCVTTIMEQDAVLKGHYDLYAQDYKGDLFEYIKNENTGITSF